jgi:hypothetical protein
VPNHRDPRALNDQKSIYCLVRYNLLTFSVQSSTKYLLCRGLCQNCLHLHDDKHRPPQAPLEHTSHTPTPTSRTCTPTRLRRPPLGCSPNPSPHSQAGRSCYVLLAFAWGRTWSVSSSVSDRGSEGTQCRETTAWGGEQSAEAGGGAGAAEEVESYVYGDYHQR